MSTVMVSAKQKLVDRIKECIRRGKLKFQAEREVEHFTSERENNLTCSVYGTSDQPFFFNSSARVVKGRGPGEYGVEVDWHEIVYTLSIFGDRKGITHPALTIISGPGTRGNNEGAKEINELLVERWKADLERIEEARQNLSIAQKEEIAEKLLRELDDEPHGPGG